LAAKIIASKQLYCKRPIKTRKKRQEGIKQLIDNYSKLKVRGDSQTAQSKVSVEYQKNFLDQWEVDNLDDAMYF
jgi:hypothetical protein